ncbi:hypothetical protein [Corallococcus aberystwythensis]|uniref:Lipoprotein n=1 Tax=Corallococcus aberystwythensis TaxID=2316722 RepID=A0A3A8QYP5_9BACT|nr:hypothetical protein [Corallococcus aberystwythensis]RKH73677.1 hypothetical protein D7W81_03215 [Corallococcus aberystwythensis]
MLRSLALTSVAALSLFCAACGGDDDDAQDPAQIEYTRSNVTGTHPVLMTMTIPGSPETPEPIQTSLVLTEDASTRNGLTVALPPLECDLTATMTGEYTFSMKPGTCTFPIPEDPELECSFSLSITGGTGGRASAGAAVTATFTGNYNVNCTSDGPPFALPVTVRLAGT